MPYQGRLPYSYKSPFNYALDQGTQTVPSLAFIGDTNNGIFSPATDNLAITTDGVERLRVTSVGNVGIGITNPVQKLEVDGNQVVFGKIISGNSLTHPNIGNALNLNLTTGEAAFRPINLIDTSGVIKIARVHNNFGAGMDLIQWDEDIENVLSRALITAESGDLRVSNVLDGSVIFQTNNIERMRLDSSGRLGLGTSSPLYTFDCRGQGAFELYNASGGGNVLNFRPSLGDANKYNISISSYDHSGNGTGPADGLSINGFDGVSICTNNSTERTERLRVTQAGLVGIGTTSPNESLEVAGNIHMSGAANRTIFNRANNALSLGTNNTARLHITNAGNVGIGTTNPGDKLELGSGNILLANNSALKIKDAGGIGRNIIGMNASSNVTIGNTQTASRFLIESTGGSEAARIDSSGRLLVGTSSARTAVFYNGDANTNPRLQIEAAAATGGASASAAVSIARVSDVAGAQPYLLLARARGTALGSTSLVSSGDGIGGLTFQAADGTDFVEAASVIAQVDGTPGANNMPGRLVFSTTAGGASSPTERMRITNAGNVGIGTTSPQQQLSVGANLHLYSGGSNNTVTETPTIRGTTNLILNAGADSDTYINFDRGRHVLLNAGADTGNVGIGSTSPTARLYISGTNALGGIRVEDSSLSASAPAIEVIGKRIDANGSPSFAGKLLLSRNRTDAAISTGINLGALAFGGNHTDGTFANILYSASITGRSEGAFNGSTDMPTALVFLTGSTGRAPDTANVDIGTERMRLDSTGRLGLGTSSPSNGRIEINYNSDDEGIRINDTRATPTTNKRVMDLRYTGANGRTAGNTEMLLLFDNNALSTQPFINAQNNTGIVFTVKQDGSVGIGTATPNESLEVAGNIHVSGADRSIFNRSNNALTFGTNNAERARIDSSGRLLVGTSTIITTNINTLSYGSIREQLAGLDGNGATKLIAQFSNSGAVAPTLAFARSNATTLGTQTPVTSGATIGRITAAGSDGTNFVEGGRIDFTADALFTTNSAPTRLVFSTTPSGSGTPTERMRLDSTGRLGLGTSSPDALLTVNGVGAHGLGSATAPSFAFTGDLNTGIYSPGADQVAISTNGTGRLFVASDGRVLHSHSGEVATNPFSNSHVPRLVTTSTETANFQGLGSVAYNGSSAGLWLGRSAGTTVNTVNALTSGNEIGGISFAGADGTAFINAARIRCIVDGAVSTNTVPGALTFQTSASGSAPSERMRLDSSGRLGLGTSSPVARLDLGTASGTEEVQVVLARQATPGDGNFRLVAKTGTGTTVNSEFFKLGILHPTGGDNAFINFYRGGAATGGFLTFTTNNNTERMRLDSSGRLGLGTSSPELQLDIAANSSSTAFSGAGVLSASRFYTGGTIATVRNNSTTEGSFAGIQLSTRNPDNINQSIGLLSVSSGIGLNAPNFVITQRTGPDTMSERMRIDSSGRVGIGTTSPGSTLTVDGTARVQNAGSFAGINVRNNNDSSAVTTTSFLDASNNLGTIDGHLFFEHLPSGGCSAVIATTPAGDRAIDRRVTRVIVGFNGTTTLNSAASTAPFIAQINSAEVARIDSSGRLLVGTSTTYSQGGFTPVFQQHATSANGTGAYRWSANTGGPLFGFTKSRGSAVGTNAIVLSGDDLGTINFSGDDGVNLNATAALIKAQVDGTPGANDMPGRLVFSVTLAGAASPTEAFRITNDRVRAYNQAAPAAVNATATLTVANIKTGIITSTSAAATDMTLPTGTDTEGGFSGIYTNMTFEWSVINTGPSLVTVLANTAHTLVGSGAVATGTSARFASRRSAANTFVTYRLS